MTDRRENEEKTKLRDSKAVEEKGRKSRSQWKLIWLQFKRHKAAIFSLWLLFVFLLFSGFGEFLVPNSPFAQFEGKKYSPPISIHFIDEEGQFHLKPFVYKYEKKLDPETWQTKWTPVRDRKYFLKFFVSGSKYKLLGFIPTDIHLFGTGEGNPPLFLFGTDNLGRDVFSRTIYATRISLGIASIGVLISLIFGIFFGGLSGYYGGVIDNMIQRTSELLLSIPKLPLWMALAASIPSQWSIIKVYMAIVVIVSLMNWPWMARDIRSKLISLREEDFISAAQSYGASDARIIFHHLIPNFLSYIIVSVTLTAPAMILLETALSFLGIGLRPPAISWGVLLEQAQNFQDVILHPWLLIPGAFVVIAILALNFVGDGLRDAADPYSYTGRGG